MNNHQPRPSYFSYLLRLWRVDDGDAPQWRASLESPSSTQLRGFSSLKALFRFLDELTAESRCPSEGNGEPVQVQGSNAEDLAPRREAAHRR